MTTATSITVPCTPATLTSLMQEWKASIADAPTMPAIAARPMSASEIAAFLTAASHDPDWTSGLLLSCTLLSGIPPIDLASAKWDLYDADAGMIEVCDEENRLFETYQLSVPALEMLEAMELRRHNVPWVFHRNGQQVNGDDLAEAFNRITFNAGIMDLSMQDLVMTYEFVALFAALFEVPLIRPMGLDDSASDAETDADDSASDADDSVDHIVDEQTGQIRPIHYF